MEIVPDRVPSIVKGTRTVAMLPKSVLLAYQVLKRGCTWNVTVDPDAEHDDRFPQLRRIGGDALNWNDRVFTLRLGENSVNAATNMRDDPYANTVSAIGRAKSGSTAAMSRDGVVKAPV